MGEGMYGDLASITPPITVPAWACAMSGKTPGQLGIYGMRNRKDTTYEGLSLATSLSVNEPQVWDVLGAAGKKSLLIGVPPGYPPKAVEGWRISCFLTPPSAKSYTHPADLAAEVEEELGGEPYIFDIPNFREKGEEFVLQQVFAMTERRFKVARRLVKNKPWDYFMLVEMGPDRLHHVFWHRFDPQHPKYEPGNPFETAFQDYYRFLDREVGALGEDDRPRRRDPGDEGHQAAGRVRGGPRRGARSHRVLRRPGVAKRRRDRRGRRPGRVHLRERHRAGRREPRPDRCVRDDRC